MSIGSQVTEAIKRIAETHFEDAAVATSVAVSATARREYPVARDGVAYRAFIAESLPIICKVGWIAFGVSQPIKFRYRRLDGRNPRTAVLTMPEMLYDVVRCTAVHEAGLPSNLRFTSDSVIRTGHDGELVLPADLLYGLILAVVAAPTNADQQTDGDLIVSFADRSAHLKGLWGRRDRVLSFVGVTG